MTKKKLGIIINPLAGLGGRVGLKGSDGADIVEKALALGGKPEAATRAAYALELLTELDELPEILTFGGDMGENTLRELGIRCTVIGRPATERSTAADTIAAARKMRDEGCDLILFAGGDGTARNVCEAIGESVPVIGIPAGVKIHSAVYAINPRNAGQAAVSYLRGNITHCKSANVMDIDEDRFRQGFVEARLYGHMLVPDEPDHIQNSKSGAHPEEEELWGMAAYVADLMEDGVLYIVGPGSTTRAIMDQLELPDTLLGVDVVKDRQRIAADVTESQLWELIQDETQPVKIIVTIIGGQGNLFGRGNQQLSPRILRRVGKENLIVAATAGKLNELDGSPLHVDTGDPDLDAELAGYIRVVVGYEQTSIYKVSN